MQNPARVAFTRGRRHNPAKLSRGPRQHRMLSSRASEPPLADGALQLGTPLRPVRTSRRTTDPFGCGIHAGTISCLDYDRGPMVQGGEGGARERGDDSVALSLRMSWRWGPLPPPGSHSRAVTASMTHRSWFPPTLEVFICTKSHCVVAWVGPPTDSGPSPTWKGIPRNDGRNGAFDGKYSVRTTASILFVAAWTVVLLVGGLEGALIDLV
jgi:hypothetical protein